MGYLVAVSFLLHFVSLFIIVVLFQKFKAQQPTGELAEQSKLKRDIEDLLIAYTSEMKEENNKLIQKLMMKKKVKEQEQENAARFYQDTHVVENKIVAPKPLQTRPVKQAIKPIPVINPVNEEEELFVPPLIEQKEDIIEQSTTAKILSLSKQGYTVKEIAKQLELGDGEVELLIKFHK